jgi:ankyrin repeat protein
LEQDPTIINDLNCEEWKLLQYACYHVHEHIVRFLFEYKSNINQKDGHFLQALIKFAIYRQFENIVHTLDQKIKWAR